MKTLIAFFALTGTAVAGHPLVSGCQVYQDYSHTVPVFIPYCPPPVVFKQIAPAAYYSIAPELQQQVFAETAQQQLQGMALQLQQLQQQLGLQPQQAQPQVQTQAQPQQQPQVQPRAQSFGHPGAALLTRKCAKCHVPGARQVAEQGAPVLFTAERQLLQLDERMLDSMDSAIAADAMPLTPQPPLSRQEKAAVTEYLESLKPPISLPPVQEPEPKSVPPIPEQETRSKSLPPSGLFPVRNNVVSSNSRSSK